MKECEEDMKNKEFAKKYSDLFMKGKNMSRVTASTILHEVDRRRLLSVWK